MRHADFLRLGDWNAICYQCGFKRKASEMEKNWQGYYVCPEHNEPRQTQDFVRAIPDVQTAPWAQPDPNTIYTYTQAQIGIASGVINSNQSFQFGSGLDSDAVTYNVTNVYKNGILVNPALWTITSTGLIFFLPGGSTTLKGTIITATGIESVLA